MNYFDNLIIFIIILFVVGSVLHILFIIYVKPKPVDYLKNALLSYLLMKCKNYDENISLNYKSMDGRMLPPFSGYDIENACFSYIQSPYDRVFGFFPSKQNDQKNIAIDKYIAKKLNSEKDVLDIFSEFVNKYNLNEIDEK